MYSTGLRLDRILDQNNVFRNSTTTRHSSYIHHLFLTSSLCYTADKPMQTVCVLIFSISHKHNGKTLGNVRKILNHLRLNRTSCKSCIDFSNNAFYRNNMGRTCPKRQLHKDIGRNQQTCSG